MIAATPSAGQLQPGSTSVPRWQQELANAISDPRELCEVLDLDPSLIAPALESARGFPLKVPRRFVAKMRKGDPKDPLLLQVLPVSAEMAFVPGFELDPVGDLQSRAGAGVLHKYHGRALAIATGACAIHCRYCFRRHFPYDEESALRSGWSRAIAALQADATLSEVILSGGDPLSLSDRRLRELTDKLACIPHIRRLRIHTRYPVVLPARIDEELLNWLQSLPIQRVIVIHANHPREIDEEVIAGCRALAAAGATLLNQSVLLAGVNDSPDTLAELSEALFAAGVLPYYLHMLDRVQGAAHFEVPIERALALHEALAARLPGYLLPRLVREIPGAPAKRPVVAV
ncbi:MAG: EF-P beta-lysylation protein EpmB [Gammaproteobacteria bacterium]|nr:EF-P beta-lysylation protein EpmB [Gammaproteobacteria bacterium]